MVAFLKFPKLDALHKISQLKLFVAEKYEQLRTEADIAYHKSKDLGKTNYELGLNHLKRGNLYDATLRFKMTIFLRPQHAQAHYQLGRCLLLKGNNEDALHAFKKAQNLQPDFPEVAYFLFTLGEASAPATIPLSVIEDYFDGLAATYHQDYSETLHYHGHSLIAGAVLPSLSGKTDVMQILDLGVGTGLCGLAIKEGLPHCTLTGIDISRMMLQEATALQSAADDRAVYDYLKHSDLVSYMASTEKKYHAVIAGISLNYLGDLAIVLGEAKKILHPDGIMAFTLSKSDEVTIGFTDDMKSFCYSASYIDSMAAAAGFKDITITEHPLTDTMTGWLCRCRT